MKRSAGQGQPPEAGRFRKGQSGNPKGRPRSEKPKTASAFDIIIDKTLTVTHGGQSREVTVEEALQHRTYQDAVAGNRSARREILKMIARREQYLAEHNKVPAPKITRQQEIDPENAEAALLILGITSSDPAKNDPRYVGRQLLLEPWAVQMAISRRRGGDSLTDKDQAEIKRSTRAADTLRWPRVTGG